MKCLIAYYSRKGNDYVSGRVVNLSVGNTEVAAKMIQKLPGGETFRIDTVKAYPADYTKASPTSRSSALRRRFAA